MSRTVIAVAILAATGGASYGQAPVQWKPHDMNRPVPVAVDPGMPSTELKAGKAPSDAVVLFDGKDLSKWQHKDGSAAKWKMGDGYFETVPKAGYIYTKQPFGDCQLHVEFWEPSPAHGTGQDRGNSGVFLMSRYEIQVLDSFQNITYPDGQAAAIYGQFPPLVNASRRPGEWQSYDIVFTAPRFKGQQVETPAYVTVLHNGIVVHDHTAILGTTGHRVLGAYSPHPPTAPLMLQDHAHPVRYRNIWIRTLGAPE